MESLIQSLKAADSTKYSKGVPTFLKDASIESLSSFTSANEDPLQILDPARHSLGYLYILNARLKTSNSINLINFADSFAATFDPKQVLLAMNEINNLANLCFSISYSKKICIAVVRPLKNMIKRLSLKSNLTGVHPVFAKTCLLAKTYNAAEEILNDSIEDVHPETYDIDIQDFLLYHYYGGMLYCGLKKFNKALEFFKIVITSPALAPSMIAMESYSKYILMSLLLHGKILPLPKYTPNCLVKAFKGRKDVLPYIEFANAFESLSLSRVQVGLCVNASFALNLLFSFFSLLEE